MVQYKRHAKGFTLIEFLVVFAIIGTLTVTSIAGFYSYNRTQSFSTSVSDVAYLLRTAKSRALSQVKPPQCINQVLKGYQVTFTSPGSTYTLGVICNTTTYTLETKTLPPSVTFAAGATTPIVFAVSRGVVPRTSSVTVIGYGLTKTITVSTTGTISIP